MEREEGKVVFWKKMVLREEGNLCMGECMGRFEMEMGVEVWSKKGIVDIWIKGEGEEVVREEEVWEMGGEYMGKLGYGEEGYLV